MTHTHIFALDTEGRGKFRPAGLRGSFLMAGYEFGDPAQSLVQQLHGCRVGDADMVRSTEGFAGNDGDVGLLEQLYREVKGVLNTAFERNRNIRISVEGSSGLGAFHAGN